MDPEAYDLRHGFDRIGGRSACLNALARNDECQGNLMGGRFKGNVTLSFGG